VATNNPVRTDRDIDTPSCLQLFGCIRETRLAGFAAYCVGQLRGLHADHRAALLYPGISQLLPKAELARGQRDAERWLRRVL
jgi:hypothetical protein